MEFQTGRSYEGFILKEQSEIPELYSKALIFEHEKSGARLLKLINEDDNRVFSITFRTPPFDDTGLPHILEHSVLTGSRKYPTKEPFVELLKGSLNTFLNAFTFPDKTMYPVASKNEQDFFNLMDVYLDAVFYPLIYERPDRLMQEGWHYEIENPDARLRYSGVVYNEMKGVFSTPEHLLSRLLQKSLFPATVYGHESGGDPDNIPSLTQEKFLAFHKAYYQPANSYIYLYGCGDTLKELAFLDRSWLQHFTKTTVEAAIPPQAPFSSRVALSATYPVAAGESTAAKTYLALGFVTGTALDPELTLGMEILTHLLLGNPAAPLRQALLKSGIGSDVLEEWSSDLLQPFLSIIVKNSEAARAEEFETLVRETLTRLAREGLEPALIEASINLTEFRLREADYGRYPKGLIYNIAALGSWLYDADPLLHLRFDSRLRKIRQQAGQGFFESLIKKYLLDNPHSCLIVLRPEPGLAQEKERLLEEKLARLKAEFSVGELEAVVAASKRLKELQAAPDREEDLRRIPMLSRSDINPQQEIIPSEQREEGGIPVLYQPIITNGIVYLHLYFNISGIDAELLPYLGLLSRLLGKIDTAQRGYSELAQEVNRHTGGIAYPITSQTAANSADNFTAQLAVKTKILAAKFPELLTLLEEVLLTSDFRNEQRIHEVVKEIKSHYEIYFSSRGNEIARRRLLSYFSPAERFNELSSGISFYRFITEIAQQFDNRITEVQEKLRKLLASLVSKNRLIIGLTGTEDIYQKFAAQINRFTGALGDASLPTGALPAEPACRQEGFFLPGSQVQYVTLGSNFRRAGYDYHGTMDVLSTLVSLDYLWNRVRVQGGAYGSGIGMRRNGDLWFSSYRDPHLQRTLEVYRQTAAYLRAFTAGEREMMKYLIGTIAGLDEHRTPAQKGEVAIRRYFSGLTHEDIQRTREQVLSTTVTDLSRYASMLDDVLSNACVCVIGSETKLKESSDRFGKLEKLIE